MLIENNYAYLNDKKFLKELQELRVKEQFLKVELLDFMYERPIQEIQGKCISGNLSVDGNSSVRRTCSFSLVTDINTYDITNIDSLISLNKKFKLYVGYTNTLKDYMKYGEIIWFPLGVYVIVTASINNSLSGSTISISAKDKMCLLNGEVGGTLSAPVNLHESYIRESDEVTRTIKTPLYNIIRESVIELGGVDPSKIIINDVPLKAKKVLRYVGDKDMYITTDGNIVFSTGEGFSPPAGATKRKPGELAGYSYVDFTYPGELIKGAGDTVTSILDSVKNILGNYEYYFDVHGNFIFQEIKNYLNTSYTPIDKLTNGDYEVNFSSNEIAYSFKNSDIIVSYSNSPNYQNIKNDFVVWGKRKSEAGAELPIRYHVAIDDIPEVPKKYGDIPWQVYLYKYGKEATRGEDPGYYYRELANEIPKLIDEETGKWNDKIDQASADYFLDFIDSKSELGKYSVNTIGRRTVVQNDPDVNTLYRPPTPDYVILEKENKEDMEQKEILNQIGQKFIQVESKKIFQNAAVGKDAFGVIRDLIFRHTTYNENINVSAMPMYYIEPNIKVEVEDSRSNIYGDYIIKNITLPLTHEGTMSFSAIRATTRL